MAVLDINDNAPVFTAQTYKGILVENNYIGASVLQVTATDWDEGDNARIQYSIPGSMAVTFHIDQRGVISSQDSVDRERYDSFRFPVLAVDMGRPTRTGSTLVIVTVDDQNDEKPTFTQPRYYFNVSENEPEGTRVGVVTADDRDGPLNNVFVYTFTGSGGGGYAAIDRFSIDGQTGVITTRRVLDRETQGIYQIGVTARDQKAAALSGTATVTIFVVDRNDNSPVFEFPTPVNNTVRVSSATPVGYLVARVVATDVDSGDNRKLDYRIVDAGHDGGEDADDEEDEDLLLEGRFRIDAETGNVDVRRSLEDIDVRTFRLRLIAIDHGQPSRSTPAVLHVVVNRTIPFGGAGGLAGTGGASFAALLFARGSLLVYVLIAVAFGCCVVVASLIVAVVVVRRKERRRRMRKNSCRMETLRTLMTKESMVSSTSSPDGTPVKTNGVQHNHPAPAILGLGSTGLSAPSTTSVTSANGSPVGQEVST